MKGGIRQPPLKNSSSKLYQRENPLRGERERERERNKKTRQVFFVLQKRMLVGGFYSHYHLPFRHQIPDPSNRILVWIEDWERVRRDCVSYTKPMTDQDYTLCFRLYPQIFVLSSSPYTCVYGILYYIFIYYILTKNEKLSIKNYFKLIYIYI